MRNRVSVVKVLFPATTLALLLNRSKEKEGKSEFFTIKFCHDARHFLSSSYNTIIKRIKL